MKMINDLPIGVPPEHRRGVRDGVPGRDQPGLDGALRPLQHLRELLAAAAHLPEPHGPAQRGRGRHVSAQVRKDVYFKEQTKKSQRKKSQYGLFYWLT